MLFVKRGELEGRHAFLAPSNPYWLRYSDDKLRRVFHNAQAARLGTERHEFAAECIRLKERLAKSSKTLNQYVNESITYKLSPEVTLYYSDNCFGHADAVGYNSKLNVLRISDLKTGENEANFDQLFSYAALFCLQYRVKPDSLTAIELRIYQNDEVKLVLADPDDVFQIMDTIKRLDKVIEDEKEGLE